MEIKLLNKIKISINRIDSFKIKSNFEKNIPVESLSFKNKQIENNFFIHIHIPKTGGTTFNTILENNFRQCFEVHGGRLIHHYPFLDNEQIKAYISKQAGMRCLSSHMFRAILPYRTASRNIVAIAFIRNPIDKFFSFYFHMRHRHGVECLEKQLKLETYIEYKIKTIGDGKFCGYLNQLTGVDDEYSYNYIKSLVENGNLYLFSTYQMDKALNFLKNRFPHDFQNILYEKENVSIKNQEITEKMKSKIKYYISDFDWKLLELAENNI